MIWNYDRSIHESIAPTSANYKRFERYEAATLYGWVTNENGMADATVRKDVRGSHYVGIRLSRNFAAILLRWDITVFERRFHATKKRPSIKTKTKSARQDCSTLKTNPRNALVCADVCTHSEGPGNSDAWLRVRAVFPYTHHWNELHEMSQKWRLHWELHVSNCCTLRVLRETKPYKNGLQARCFRRSFRIQHGLAQLTSDIDVQIHLGKWSKLEQKTYEAAERSKSPNDRIK